MSFSFLFLFILLYVCLCVLLLPLSIVNYQLSINYRAKVCFFCHICKYSRIFSSFASDLSCFAPLSPVLPCPVLFCPAQSSPPSSLRLFRPNFIRPPLLLCLFRPNFIRTYPSPSPFVCFVRILFGHTLLPSSTLLYFSFCFVIYFLAYLKKTHYLCTLLSLSITAKRRQKDGKRTVKRQ